MPIIAFEGGGQDDSLRNYPLAFRVRTKKKFLCYFLNLMNYPFIVRPEKSFFLEEKFKLDNMLKGIIDEIILWKFFQLK